MVGLLSLGIVNRAIYRNHDESLQRNTLSSAVSNRIATEREFTSPWVCVAQAPLGAAYQRSKKRHGKFWLILPTRYPRIEDRIDRAAGIPHCSSGSGDGPWPYALVRLLN